MTMENDCDALKDDNNLVFYYLSCNFLVCRE